ncbi:MAG: hypothetical protein ACP5T0_05200 [Verrucomicrobiia bacterium]
MRVSGLLIISLLGNLILGFALILNLRQSPSRVVVARTTSTPNVLTQQIIKALPVVKTNVLKERFSWQEIEASDYPTYISNLRAVGCPEQTIRDIIIADVNHLYARKRVSERTVINDQWWKEDPDMSFAEAEARRYEALERERRILLAQLLGANWDEEERFEKSSLSISGLVLPGQILSKLSPEIVQSLNASYQKMKEAYERYLASRKALGLDADPVELARIRKEFRSDIEKILTPEQLEEFLLRYSDVSSQLRKRSKSLNLTPQEFRAIFRVLDRIESQMSVTDFANTDTAAQRRAMLEATADNSIKQILGEERFQIYKYGADTLYTEAKNLTRNLGISDDMAEKIYEINRLVRSEVERINSDTSLTDEQKKEALETANQAQMNAMRELLGEEVFKKWQQMNNTQR